MAKHRGKHKQQFRNKERVAKRRYFDEFEDDDVGYTTQYNPKPKRLEPMKQVQSEYMQSINSYPYILATGFAGTGKTYIPTRMACNWLKSGDIEKIILARPAVSASQSLGFFKGTKEEKMKQWLLPIWSTLLEEFSESKLDTMIKYNQLECVPLEVIKGNSWKNAFIIIDEVEDCSFKEIKSILTRIGEGSTMVLAGDVTQADLDDSGVYRLLELMEESSGLREYIAHHDFSDPGDIVRSAACKAVIVEFAKFGE